MKLNFTKLSIYLIFHLLILYNFACTQKENSNLLIQKWLLTEIKDQTRIQKFQDEGEIYFLEFHKDGYAEGYLYGMHINAEWRVNGKREIYILDKTAPPIFFYIKQLDESKLILLTMENDKEVELKFDPGG
ncbi:MAG: hypothetical protein H7A24_05570 [Leptospiraceae bacterium]|nr:hypothetical protein [Leptospiraceae bacterium]MCP5511327.1 hypothetical protein [Leptospiraceae bacterium]